MIELKFNKSAQEALEQINTKHYADAFALRGKTMEKIGMNFMIDEDKTIVLDWWKFGEQQVESAEHISGQETRQNSGWYTLQGQRVEHPTKGIYIHNGKKVVLRQNIK